MACMNAISCAKVALKAKNDSMYISCVLLSKKPLFTVSNQDKIRCSYDVSMQVYSGNPSLGQAYSSSLPSSSSSSEASLPTVKVSTPSSKTSGIDPSFAANLEALCKSSIDE